MEHEKLKAELEAFGACDPVKLQQKKEAIALAKESAVRWTGGSPVPHFKAHVLTSFAENTGCLMKLAKDYGCDADLYAALGINESWEDLAV